MSRECPWRRSGRHAAAHVRAVDLELLDDHAVHDAAARLDAFGFLAQVSAHVRLVCVFYVVAHFAIYLLLDQAGKLGALWEDIIKRPYITIGVIALLMLIPLAATSTSRAQRRLGRRWTRLHQLIYVVAVLGVWHFWWQVKKDITQPVLYASGLAVLLGYRLYKNRKSPALRFSGPSLAAKNAS